jgi:hypothetical protein
MKAIDKAITITPDETREEIIKNCCPYYDYYKTNLEAPMYCKGDYDEGLCIKCWEREVEDYIQEYNDKQLTFEQLEKSPIEGIELNYSDNDEFEKSALRDGEVIYIEHRRLQNKDIPKLITWLKDVNYYCEQIKNQIKYVDWKTARNHMEQGNKAKFKEVEYFIDDDNLYWELKSEPELTYITLLMLDSKEWILL